MGRKEMEEKKPASLTVMLVEDTDDIRQLIRMQLEARGYRVIEAANGQEALDLAQREPLDLVLMDISMPELDGISVAYVLRGSEELRDVPIVTLTAYDGADYREEAAEAGCDAYLTKPIDFDRLGELIERLARKRSG